jgi:hypothetical protein
MQKGIAPASISPLVHATLLHLEEIFALDRVEESKK